MWKHIYCELGLHTSCIWKHLHCEYGLFTSCMWKHIHCDSTAYSDERVSELMGSRYGSFWYVLFNKGPLKVTKSGKVWLFLLVNLSMELYCNVSTMVRLIRP